MNDKVIQRETNAPTQFDRVDKSLLPAVMQVKNFGRAGRTKYTHLKDQDTTDRDAPWFQNRDLVDKTMAKMGGMKGGGNNNNNSNSSSNGRKRRYEDDGE